MHDAEIYYLEWKKNYSALIIERAYDKSDSGVWYEQENIFELVHERLNMNVVFTP